jgi:hypothetical protein
VRWSSDDMTDDGDNSKGIVWRLPKLQTHDWGRMGPAFGYGIGCGVGLGAGIVGGSRFRAFSFSLVVLLACMILLCSEFA